MDKNNFSHERDSGKGEILDDTDKFEHVDRILELSNRWYNKERPIYTKEEEKAMDMLNEAGVRNAIAAAKAIDEIELRPSVDPKKLIKEYMKNYTEEEQKAREIANAGLKREYKRILGCEPEEDEYY